MAIAVIPVSSALLDDIKGGKPSTGLDPVICMLQLEISLMLPEDIIHARGALPSLTDASLALYRVLFDDEIVPRSFSPLSAGKVMDPQIRASGRD
jgi:hypothetical protein